MRNFLKTRKTEITLILILILAALFRLYGLDWDQGQHLHPDERMLIMVTEKIHLPKSFSEFLTRESPLNPKFFPYGSFPIYLLRLVSNLTAWITGLPELTQYGSMNLVGRVISALFDIGTVIIIFLLGKKIFSPKVGLLGASFYSFCTFPIQLSHFFAVDTFLSFFVLLTLYRLIVFYEKPSLKNSLLAGASLGFALATKVSATVLLIATGTAAIMDLILVVGKRFRLLIRHKKIFYSSQNKIIILKEKLLTLLKFILRMSKYLGLSSVLTLITFLILEPYATIDFPTFLRQTKEQQAMTQNAYVFPYTLQYVGTIPYFYHLKNMILWGTGIPLGTVSVIAVIFLIVYLFKEFPKPGNEDQEGKILILLSFFIAYFLVIGSFAVKFMRYLLPLYPIFSLFAAWFLEIVSQRINFFKKNVSFSILSVAVLLPTVLWSVAFLSIYRRPTTRITASQWISKNIPPDSILAREHWDDGLPLFDGDRYGFVEMPLYESDQSLVKWEIVNSNLQKADYIILASNRLYVPLQKLSDCNKFKVCYPKTAEYYKDLFSGNLGFEKVAEFNSHPSFFNFVINDQSADESFTVYDHPRIIIFKKDAKFQKK